MPMMPHMPVSLARARNDVPLVIRQSFV